ncbi:4-hydroxybenzoate octaprenyltransferase [Candidatus Magnetaquicoccaceae bacterium FCR-1]|uniref:4-hydroxybenzoate octaprenyltransferase n=1 Tax=Candidatus Magnetaquiglobus chichijimensis TaxID=3141448 RepID=A0ABQ0C8L9_9PROT
MNRLIARLPKPWMRECLLLMRVDRPIGTWLLLWPALWGVIAAGSGTIHPGWLVIFSLGAFVMRSAGCVANDLTDRDIDPLVARTRNRPLAARRVTPTLAKRLLFALLVIALLLGLTLPVQAWQLCFVGAILAVTYPFAKRLVPVPQLYLGIAFAWGVPIAWVTVAHTLEPTTWLLFGAAMTWTIAFDTIYAMMDREDDLKIGVNSTAIFFGRYDIAATGLLFVVTLGLLVEVGLRLGMGWGYFLLLGGALLHAIWQIVSIRNQENSALMRAFVANKWFGMLIFSAFLAGG